MIMFSFQVVLSLALLTLSLSLPPTSLLLLSFSPTHTHLQLVLFAQTKFALTDFIRENTRTFVKLFVATPADTFGESVPIPSPISYLYTMDDVLDQINFTANAVSPEITTIGC